MHPSVKLGFTILLFALAACGGPSYSPYGGTEQPTQVKIGKPYSAGGSTYTPSYSPSYSETGMASWYGPEFHNRMTASGERYDQHRLTAAHRTLPLPSMVKVTRTDTGQSVIVRVNDRGPFSKGRIIDLSKAAASEIDMIGKGTAEVRVEYLSRETDQYISSLGLKAPWWQGDSPTQYAEAAPVAPLRAEEAAPVPLLQASVSPPSALATTENQFSIQLIKPAVADTPQAMGQTAYRIQTGSFSDRANADASANRFIDLASPEVRPTEVGGQTYYRVSLGPVYDYATAQRILERAKATGASDARLIVE